MAYSRQEKQMREAQKAKAHSFQHIPSSARPTTICVITMPNPNPLKRTGESGHNAADMHLRVQALYADVPKTNRGVGHGVCAEADAMTKLFNHGVSERALKGASSWAYTVGKAGKPIPPCASCAWVLDKLGITYDGD